MIYATVEQRIEPYADTMTKGEPIRPQAAEIEGLRASERTAWNAAVERDEEIEKLRDLLSTSRPFVAFHAIELREMLERPLPPSAQPGAAEQVERRIAEIEKLVADIDEALGD